MPKNLGGRADKELISRKQTAYKIERPPRVKATGKPYSRSKKMLINKIIASISMLNF